MSRRLPVLLGGRTDPMECGRFNRLFLVWFPVIVMLLVIARESTATFSSVNTSPILRRVFEALFGHVTDDKWEAVHHHLRKTGHFLGYGTLGITWLRAFLLTWLVPFQHCAATVWRRWSLQMAICCTALVAALDEVHQAYIPDRTGLVTDVLLDTSGAIALCLFLSLCWLKRSGRIANIGPA